LSYQGLEEENLDQKSPGPPNWGLMQQASSSLITKKQKNAKKPNTKSRKADRDRRPKLKNFLIYTLIYAKLQPSDESLMHYVAILWAEFGQPCPIFCMSAGDFTIKCWYVRFSCS
jgi:hypothetical protein